MSTPPVIVTLDQVRATARGIVDQEGTRRAIAASAHRVIAMALTLCALDDIARLAAGYFATRDAMLRAGSRGDDAAERAADDRLQEIEADLRAELTALGFFPAPIEKDA